jgi:ABC-type methionine transport system permease subunit
MEKSTLLIVLWAAMGAVVITLGLGLITMLRGKDSFMSNRLMQIRVGVQMLALILFAILLWSSRG